LRNLIFFHPGIWTGVGSQSPIAKRNVDHRHKVFSLIWIAFYVADKDHRLSLIEPNTVAEPRRKR
jgi:hypothetical protein